MRVLFLYLLCSYLYWRSLFLYRASNYCLVLSFQPGGLIVPFLLGQIYCLWATSAYIYLGVVPILLSFWKDSLLCIEFFVDSFFLPSGLQLCFHCLLVSVASDEKFILLTILSFSSYSLREMWRAWVYPAWSVFRSLGVHIHVLHQVQEGLAVITSDTFSAPSCPLSVTPVRTPSCPLSVSLSGPPPVLCGACQGPSCPLSVTPVRPPPVLCLWRLSGRLMMPRDP